MRRQRWVAWAILLALGSASAQLYQIPNTWKHSQQGPQTIFTSPSGQATVDVISPAPFSGSASALLDQLLADYQKNSQFRLLARCQTPGDHTAEALWSFTGPQGPLEERVTAMSSPQGDALVLFMAPPASFPQRQAALYRGGGCLRPAQPERGAAPSTAAPVAASQLAAPLYRIPRDWKLSEPATSEFLFTAPSGEQAIFIALPPSQPTKVVPANKVLDRMISGFDTKPRFRLLARCQTPGDHTAEALLTYLAVHVQAKTRDAKITAVEVRATAQTRPEVKLLLFLGKPGRFAEQEAAVYRRGGCLSAAQVQGGGPATAGPEPVTAFKFGAVLRPAQLPAQAGYQIALPAGWKLGGRGGDVAATSPGGGLEVRIFPPTSLSVLAFSSPSYQALYRRCFQQRSGLRCMHSLLQAMQQFDRRPWGIQSVQSLILQSMAALFGPLGHPHFTAQSSDRAELSAALQRGGVVYGAELQLGLIRTPSPVWGAGASETWVLASLCSRRGAPLNQGDLATCGTILSTFQPSARWLLAPLQRLVSFYAAMERQIQLALERLIIIHSAETSLAIFRQTDQTIASWGQQMRQMQWQEFSSQMATNTQVGAMWDSALAGQTLYKDPTSGSYYSLNTQFQTGPQSLCLNSGGGVTTGACGPGQSTLQRLP